MNSPTKTGELQHCTSVAPGDIILLPQSRQQLNGQGLRPHLRLFENSYFYFVHLKLFFSFLDVQYSIKSACRLVQVHVVRFLARTELFAVIQYAHCYHTKGTFSPEEVRTVENLWQEESIEMCMFAVRSWPYCLSRIWSILKCEDEIGIHFTWNHVCFFSVHGFIIDWALCWEI